MSMPPSPVVPASPHPGGESAVGTVAVTVIGVDRPGIVADVTGALAGVEGNLEDSTMTLLRGQFAMVVLVRTPSTVGAVLAALAGLAADGSLAVDVRAVTEDPPPTPPMTGEGWVLHVNGADRPGIVAAVTGVLARHGVNIVDLGTRLAGELYVLTAEVVLPEEVDPALVRTQLEGVAMAIGVNARLMPLETDEM